MTSFSSIPALSTVSLLMFDVTRESVKSGPDHTAHTVPSENTAKLFNTSRNKGEILIYCLIFKHEI